jgi:hypothetical protein
MATSQPKTLSLSPILVLCLALIGAGSMLGYHLGFYVPRMLEVRAFNGGGNGYSFGDDFYPIWLTTRQWRVEHCDFYSPAMTREIQKGLFGRPLDPHNPNDPPVDYRQFAYPAYTDLLLWPAALLEFPKLRLVLAVLLPLLTAVSIRFWMLALDWRVGPVRFATIVVLTLCTYELLEAFFAEQPGLLVGFFLAGAALALRRNRLLLAGVLLSLTLIKPQVTLLAILYLLFWSFSDRRRVRLWIGFFSVTICLAVASFWSWPHWFLEWSGILLGYHRYAMPPLISVLLGLHLNAVFGPVLIAIMLAAGARLAWQTRSFDTDSSRFWLTLSLLLAVTSVALLPGQAIYDHIILIPGILLVLRSRQKLRDAGRIPRALLAAGTLVLFWPWISAFALLVIRLFDPAVFNSIGIFVLPIRTAASLPFTVLALLWGLWRITPTTSASA